MKELQQPTHNDDCLDIGLLVSLRDGELTADERTQAMAHLAICRDCAADERNMDTYSQEVYNLLSTLEPSSSEVPQPATAFSAVQARLDAGRFFAALRMTITSDDGDARQAVSTLTDGRKRLFPLNKRQRRYSWLTAAVAAALIVLLVLPNASVLANEFLALFRVQKFQPVTVDPRTLGEELIAELQNFSDVQVPVYTDNQSGLTQAQVQKSIHFPLLLPGSLPSGVGHVKQFNLIGGDKVIFTFDAAKVRAYMAKTGQNSVSIPAQLDGAKFTITVNPGVLVNYFTNCQSSTNGTVSLSSEGVSLSSAKSSSPEKMLQQCKGGKTFSVIEIPSPVVQPSGNATLKDLRDFLLSLPKQSPQMQNLLHHIDLNTGTVPLPIPSEVNAQQVTTHGASGILLADNSMSLALVLWQSHGIIYAVGAATNNSAQLLDAANSLH